MKQQLNIPEVSHIRLHTLDFWKGTHCMNVVFAWHSIQVWKCFGLNVPSPTICRWRVHNAVNLHVVRGLRLPKTIYGRVSFVCAFVCLLQVVWLSFHWLDSGVSASSHRCRFENNHLYNSVLATSSWGHHHHFAGAFGMIQLLRLSVAAWHATTHHEVVDCFACLLVRAGGFGSAEGEDFGVCADCSSEVQGPFLWPNYEGFCGWREIQHIYIHIEIRTIAPCLQRYRALTRLTAISAAFGFHQHKRFAASLTLSGSHLQLQLPGYRTNCWMWRTGLHKPRVCRAPRG